MVKTEGYLAFLHNVLKHKLNTDKEGSSVSTLMWEGPRDASGSCLWEVTN